MSDYSQPGIVPLAHFPDERGFLDVVWKKGDPHPMPAIRQIISNNSASGVIRGMHYQWPLPMGKFVMCLCGKIFDVLIDVRRDSPEFGEWQNFFLEEGDGTALWVPRGYAHGFQALRDGTVVAYLCDEAYQPEYDHSISPVDTDIGIPWVYDGQMSEKDLKAPKLKDIPQEELPYGDCL